MEDEPRACIRCRYWRHPESREPDDGRTYGECHRRAPPSYLFKDSPAPTVALWPRTWANDWCGEWTGQGGAGQ
jgi:hypothetical protein